MATVNGITAEKAQEIEDASVVSGTINVNGHLILTTAGGTTIDAGLVIDSTGVVAHAALSATHGVGQIVGASEAQALSNKTLVTPTIASFVNANHNHSNSANGGLVGVDAVLASFDTSLVTRRFSSGTQDNPLSLAVTNTLSAGKYIIMAACSGYQPDSGSQQTRMSFYLSTSAGTLYTAPSDQSVDQATHQGGVHLNGYLETGSDAVITFFGMKLNTGTACDTATEGFLIALRVSDMA